MRQRLLCCEGWDEELEREKEKLSQLERERRELERELTMKKKEMKRKEREVRKWEAKERRKGEDERNEEEEDRYDSLKNRCSLSWVERMELQSLRQLQREREKRMESQRKDPELQKKARIKHKSMSGRGRKQEDMDMERFERENQGLVSHVQSVFRYYMDKESQQQRADMENHKSMLGDIKKEVEEIRKILINLQNQNSTIRKKNMAGPPRQTKTVNLQDLTVKIAEPKKQCKDISIEEMKREMELIKYRPSLREETEKKQYKHTLHDDLKWQCELTKCRALLVTHGTGEMENKIVTEKEKKLQTEWKEREQSLERCLSGMQKTTDKKTKPAEQKQKVQSLQQKVEDLQRGQTISMARLKRRERKLKEDQENRNLCQGVSQMIISKSDQVRSDPSKQDQTEQQLLDKSDTEGPARKPRLIIVKPRAPIPESTESPQVSSVGPDSDRHSQQACSPQSHSTWTPRVLKSS